MKTVLCIFAGILILWSMSMAPACKSNEKRSVDSSSISAGDTTHQSSQVNPDSSALPPTCNDCPIPPASDNKKCQFTLTGNVTITCSGMSPLSALHKPGELSKSSETMKASEPIKFNPSDSTTNSYDCPPYCYFIFQPVTGSNFTSDNSCANCIKQKLQQTGSCCITVPAGMKFTISDGTTTQTCGPGSTVTFTSR